MLRLPSAARPAGGRPYTPGARRRAACARTWRALREQAQGGAWPTELEPCRGRAGLQQRAAGKRAWAYVHESDKALRSWLMEPVGALLWRCDVTKGLL